MSLSILFNLSGAFVALLEYQVGLGHRISHVTGTKESYSSNRGRTAEERQEASDADLSLVQNLSETFHRLFHGRHLPFLKSRANFLGGQCNMAVGSANLTNAPHCDCLDSTECAAIWLYRETICGTPNKEHRSFFLLPEYGIAIELGFLVMSWNGMVVEHCSRSALYRHDGKPNDLLSFFVGNTRSIDLYRKRKYAFFSSAQPGMEQLQLALGKEILLRKRVDGKLSYRRGVLRKDKSVLRRDRDWKKDTVVVASTRTTDKLTTLLKIERDDIRIPS